MSTQTETANGLTVSFPSDREIVLTRSFDAPRELVWEAVSKPEHVKKWWGRRGSTMVECDMDFRPGGAWRFVVREQDGNDYPFKGVYREILPPERAVQTFIFDVEPFSNTESLETMALTEEDGRTTLTATILYDSRETRDAVAATGMAEGAGETYDRLAEYLTTIS